MIAALRTRLFNVAFLVIGVVAFGLFTIAGLRHWSQNQIARGERIYTEACASCHGANLEGQADWTERLPSGRLPAPPHNQTGHTWHHSDDDLFRIIKFGMAAFLVGYESDMPAYNSLLTDDEILLVIQFIKSGWPERERQYQEARSAQTEQ